MEETPSLMTPESSPAHLKPVPTIDGGATPEVAAEIEIDDGRPVDWDGITPPRSRGIRGSGARFLTDVIVDLGFAERERVDQAIEVSRQQGTAPEHVLLEWG